MIIHANNKGATLIETSVTIIVVAILISGAGTALYSTVLGARDQAAINQLETLKKAIVGEPRTVPVGEKSGSRYGYLGDMGSLPPALSSLESVGAQPDYSVDPILQLGRGWRGPYLSPTVSAGMTDAWGNGIVYSTAAGTSALTGATLSATLRSLGADGMNGTADDHVVEIYKSETFSKVIGYVKDAFGATVPGVDVQLAYTSNGVIINPPAAAVTDNDGLYSYDDIPHGSRVLQLMPKISYAKGTGLTTGGNRNNVQFVVENLSKDNLTVSAIKLSWTTDPASDFKTLTINQAGSPEYTGTVASGTTITFGSTKLLTGTGVTQEPFRVDISGLVMVVPDAIIGTVGTGGTIRFDLGDFEEAGTTTDSDMTGVTFTAEFTLVSPSGTSKTLFSPLRK